VCQRSSFITAAREGRAVQELPGKADSLVRAQMEMESVHTELMKVLAGERAEASSVVEGVQS
jgi:chromosome partitioning protein